MYLNVHSKILCNLIQFFLFHFLFTAEITTVITIYFHPFAGVVLLIALIVFPVMVSRDLNQTVIETTWSIRWAYMLNWAALIVNVCAVILLLNNRDTEETYLREVSKS